MSTRHFVWSSRLVVVSTRRLVQFSLGSTDSFCSSTRRVVRQLVVFSSGVFLKRGDPDTITIKATWLARIWLP